MIEQTESFESSRAKVVAAIPSLNTGHSIRGIVLRVRNIDDGSSDQSGEMAHAAGATVIRHKLREGAGAATRSGWELAKQENADILVTIDGDGQHNPDEIPRVIAPILKGKADIVLGSRFLGQPTNMPAYRKFGIGIITLLFNLGCRQKVTDAQCCFRAYNKRALETLNITEEGFAFSVELLLQGRQRGLVITEVPVSCIYYPGGHSLNPLIHGLAVALSVVRLRFRGIPGK
jgi:glycosyltransferase involved in cell wall biosynthesis